MFNWLIPLLVFIAVVLLVINIQKWMQQLLLKRHAMSVAKIKALSSDKAGKTSVLEELFFKVISIIGMVQQSWLNNGWRKKIENKIKFHPKWQFRPAEQWLAAKELSAFGGIIFGQVLTTDLLWAIGLGLVGFYLPDLWLREKARYRKQSIMKELPNTLDLLSSCVEAGLGFEQSLAVILERKRQGYIYIEFSEMMQKIQMGRAREDALKAMAVSVDENDFSTFISALIQSEKMGVSVAETLKLQASQLRIKNSQKVEKQALEAPVKMLFPLIAFIFPVVFIILFGPIILRFIQGF